ncbi:putative nuclease HARBI1 [Mytilus trossulus]|uniref:putative nuclease HARBI1 n=1 Tax=Mytilus trossulus TaxID=6551 RepID=UPI0030052E70
METVFTEFLLSDDDSDNDCDSESTVIFGAVLQTFLQRESRVRIDNYISDVVAQFTSVEFRRIYRISVDCFQHLCQLLSTCQEMSVRSPQFGGRERISLEKTVLIALRYLGHQENVRIISNIFDVADSSVIVSRDRFISAILNNLKDRFIRWPSGAAEQNDVVRKFREKRGFPGIVGCIDGTHIHIKPPTEHPQSYVNRKSFHSVILQAVCLQDMKISNYFAGFPGSVHDSRVLRQSDLWDEANMACGQNHILGDGAYPIKTWLMTPYRNTGNLTQIQKRYNAAHSATRSIIERVFAMLKGRFRRLRYIEVQQIKTVNEIMITCCVLHNISILDWDAALDMMDDDEEDNIQQNVNNLQGPDQQGILKRDQIAANLQ